METRTVTMHQGPMYDVAAYAGASPLRITTRDVDYLRRHVRRHMPAMRHEVPETWYARLDDYLNEALRSGRVAFERYAGATYIITARMVGPANPAPDGDREVR
jgi:hypothetical protein